MVQTAASSPALSAGDWRLRTIVRTSVIGGAVAIYLCLVGIVPVFAERPLIVGVIELGQAALLITFGVVGYIVAASVVATSRLRAVLIGAAAGAISG